MITDQNKHDLGIISTLLDRFEHHRLPAVLAMQQKVDEGEILNEMDLRFLKEVSADINSNNALLERHPDCKAIATRMLNLCCNITRKGLQNEKQ